MPIISGGGGVTLGSGLSIGRAGRSSPLLLNNPSVWAVQGGNGSPQTITLRVISTVSTPADALRLRDQLLGYIDNWDEPIVPVIVNAEPRLTGYYRVTGIQIDTDPVLVGLGTFTADVSLEPVMGFAQPIMESIVSGALLTNAVGAVLGDVIGFHASPVVALNDYTSTGGGTLAFPTPRKVDVAGTPTSMRFVYSPTTLSHNSRFSCDPTKFYDGAATFEQGAALQPVVGRYMVQADIVNWRLSNGLVRVTPNSSNATLDISHYNGVSWSPIKTWVLTQGGAGWGTWNAITVLRNSVEETIVRLTGPSQSGGIGLVTIDISLRRGDRMVRFYISHTGTAVNWRFSRSVVEAATAITYGAVTLGGIRATATDADGNRYVLVSYGAASTTDLVNGGIVQAGPFNSADFGVGSTIGAGSSPDDATSLAKEYLAAQAETQRVVPR